jgi:hypothetical protein
MLPELYHWSSAKRGWRSLKDVADIATSADVYPNQKETANGTPPARVITPRAGAHDAIAGSQTISQGKPGYQAAQMSQVVNTGYSKTKKKIDADDHERIHHPLTAKLTKSLPMQQKEYQIHTDNPKNGPRRPCREKVRPAAGKAGQVAKQAG